MKLLLTLIFAVFSISAFAAPPVQSTIDQCIKNNKANPNRYAGCYGAVVNQVRTQAKDQVQQTYKEGLNKAEQQSQSQSQFSIGGTASRAPTPEATSKTAAPGVTMPKLPNKPAVQQKQQEPKKTGPRIKYY